MLNRILTCISLLILVTCSYAQTPQPVSSFFFGMDDNRQSDPWPSGSVALSSWRTLGGAVTWHSINTAEGVYDWSRLDTWIGMAKGGGQDILFDVYSTPTWASSNPIAVCGGGIDTSGGGCFPPNDLRVDGTGADQHLKDFLTALVNHEGAGTIKYYECWNEPNVTTEWTGTVSQLIRICQDIQATVLSLDQNAKFVSPAISGGGRGAVSRWLTPYLAGGGSAVSDYIGFHGYGHEVANGIVPTPEQIVPRIVNVQSAVNTYAPGKPIWDTEGSWGQPDNAYYHGSCAAQQAFVPRYYLLQITNGVERFYWYGWDFANSGQFYANGGLNCAGNAYNALQSWVLGNTPTGPCVASGNIYTCNFIGPKNLAAQAIWDSAGTCSGNSCPITGSIAVESQFTQYEDITGVSHPIIGSMVPVSAIPIWLTTNP